MAANENFVDNIDPVNHAIEWLIKGMNLGFYFGIFFAKQEIMKYDTGSRRYAWKWSSAVLGNMLRTGGSLGTLMFLVSAMERFRGVRDGLNYGIGTGITLWIWYEAWRIPRHHLGKSIVFYSLGAWFLGNMLNNQASV